MVKKVTKRERGRPPEISETDMVSLTGETAKTLLQEDTERRAIVERLVRFGGRATLGELNEAFGYDMRKAVRALVRSGWVSVLPAKRAPKLPRRPSTLNV